MSILEFVENLKPGMRGHSLLSYDGIPPADHGRDFDERVDMNTGLIYKKIAGAWVLSSNKSLRGPKGDDGDPGDPGPRGAAGTNGTNGTNGAAGETGPSGFRSLYRATWASLAAITGSVVGQGAVVAGDAGTHTDPVAGGTVSNSGRFTWETGGWRRIGNADGADEFVAMDTRVIAAETSLTALAGLEANEQIIGRSMGLLATGTSLPTGTYIFVDFSTKHGVIDQLGVFALAAGIVWLGVFDRNGSVNSEAVPLYRFDVVPGVNIFEGATMPSIPISANQRVGIVQATGVVAANSSASGDSGGHYSATSDPGKFIDDTATTNVRLQVGVRIRQNIPDRLKSLQSRTIDDLERAETIGRPEGGLNAGTSIIGANTYLLRKAVKRDRVMQVLRVQLQSPGTLHIKVMRYTGTGTILEPQPGDKFVQIGTDYEVPFTAAGPRTLKLGEGLPIIPVPAGCHWGFWHNGMVRGSGSTTGDAGGYFSGIGNVNEIIDDTPTTNIQLGIGADFGTPLATLEQVAVLGGGGSSVTVAAPTAFNSFLIIGQSQHGTPRSGGDGIAIPHAYIWDSVAGEIVPFLRDGSPFPAVADQYFELTGHGCVFVPAAVGGTSIIAGDWSATGPLRAIAMGKLNAAHAALDTDSWAYQFGGILFAQGESDGNRIDENASTGADYATALASLISYFQTQTGLGTRLPFYISELGRRGDIGETAGWAAVRAAQRAAVRANEHVYLAFTGAKNFPARVLMSDEYHYKPLGYIEMGRAEGTCAAYNSHGRC